MSWISRLFRTKTGKDKLDREIERELGFHIDEMIRENVASGMTPEEGRRQAMMSFGGIPQMVEECRRTRRFPWLDDFLHDVRFGCRVLLKSPGYTIAAVLALSLGIGPNTALFTIFDAMILRPRPIPVSERVVSLGKAFPQVSSPAFVFSYPEYRYLADRTTTLEELSANAPSHLRMNVASLESVPAQTGNAGAAGPTQGADPVLGLFVTSSYFSVMRTDPVVGSNLTPADDDQAAPPYPAMLSANFWERRFGGDRQIIGKTITFSGIPAVIVGITPRDFMGARVEVPDVWLSLSARADPRRRERDETPSCILEGRLKPGIGMPQAQAELTSLLNSFYADSPDSAEKWTVSVTPATSLGAKGTGLLIAFTLLQAAIGLVLLIACANVAGLLLGKAISRQKEIAVRLSLGASRGRLLRQLLTEALLIAQLAGLISLLMTWWILKILVQITMSVIRDYGLSDGGTYLVNVTPDSRILLYALGISILTAIAFGLLPAILATRPNLTEALNEDSPALGGKRKHAFQGWAVSAQVAVCMVLLIGAATLVRSSILLTATDPGFDAAHVLSISILNPTELGYSAGRTATISHELQSRLAALPGIGSAASASRVPLGGLVSRTTVVLAGMASPGVQEQRRVEHYPYTFVSAGYFETLGIAMLQGRSFTQQEIMNRAPLALISSALARTLWPGESALGKLITIGAPTPDPRVLQAPLFLPSVEVIGVVRDVYSDSMMSPDPGAVYLPSQQAGWERNLFVRTPKDPATLVGTLSPELQSIDKSLSATFQPLSLLVAHDTAFIVLRTIGMAFSIVGALGLVLASVGIYSMVGYAVSRQTREIGVRMALGAHRGDVRREIVGRSMRPVGVGIAVGTILGAILSLLMSAIHGVSFLGLGSLAGISAMIVMVALVATFIPARKAMNLEPSIALRAH